ncbi:C4-dicarboxylate TRAP transporter substrate-binding protein [Roseovarius sp. CAU 1744]|uniref:C4-dicarboxylate TRAP transporter substrate-binding protein n=1 Tax=Roseovarius sp. CAU 1744 TaxID=3140368 RepID=UPI00325B8F50
MKIKLLVARAALSLLSLSSLDAAWAQEYPKMNLRLAHFGPKVFVQSGIDQWWADEIEERSGGNIKIRIFWGGAAGKPLEILGLVGAGAVDFGAVPQAYFPNELPLIGAPNSVPYVFTTREAAAEVSERLVAENAAVQAELRRNNVKPLFFHPMNSYYPLCTKPVKAMADFEGVRIRSFGAYQPPMWEALGAVGVNVLPSDIYEGLQRGRLDCGFFSTDLYEVTKLYEVAKYLSTAGVGPVTTWPIWVNLDKWENVYSDDVKDLILEVSQEAAARSLATVAEAETASLAFLKAQGVEVVEFVEPDAYDSAIPDMQEVWFQDMVARGLGEEAKTVVDHWRTIQAELE